MNENIVIFVIAVLVMLYFSYHAVRGENGLMAWWNTRPDYHSIKQKMDNNSDALLQLQRANSRVKSEKMDLDNLEYEARRKFLGQSRDIIILHGKVQKAN